MSNDSLIEKLDEIITLSNPEEMKTHSQRCLIERKVCELAISIKYEICQHEAQQPSEDVVDRVARAIMREGKCGLTINDLHVLCCSREAKNDGVHYDPDCLCMRGAKAAIAAMNMGDAGKDLTPNSSTKYARSTDQGAHDAGGLNPPPSTHTLNQESIIAEAAEAIKVTYDWMADASREPSNKELAKVVYDIVIKHLQQREITEHPRADLCNLLYPGGVKHPQQGEWEWLLKEVGRLKQATMRGYIDNKSPEEIERICKIIKGFWDLHSTEPATGFTPEELAKEIVNGKHSPPT